MLIGQSGVVNVGSLHLVTPTKQFMEDLISKGGVVSDVHTQRLFEGNVPLSDTGLITVKGKVNAVDTITATANSVNVEGGASLRAGRQVQLEFGSIVNTQNVQSGNELVKSSDGRIYIVAAEDVRVAGRVSADGVAGEQAGNIDIRAGNDIHVEAGAEISARGVGQNSDGGEVIIFADRNSYLQDGAVVDVSAQNGKGGFLEFSAVDTVEIVGNGLRSSYGGTILIDPEDIVWKGDALTESEKDYFSHGANIILEATNSISLTNVYLSSRQVGGSTVRSAHLGGNSTGHSGNITLKAPVIEFTNSQILAHATGAYNAGNVTIKAEQNNFLHEFDTVAPRKSSITIDAGSVIKGNDIKVEVITSAGLKVIDEKEVFGDVGQQIIGAIMEWVNPLVNLATGGFDILIPVLDFDVLSATSSIQIDGELTAANTIEILSTAEVESEISSIGVAGISVNVSRNVDRNPGDSNGRNFGLDLRR
jgi:hypothetical protein